MMKRIGEDPEEIVKPVEIKKNQFQLLASVCIFIASKFKESNPLCAEKLVVYSDFSITAQEITVKNYSIILLY